MSADGPLDRGSVPRPDRTLERGSALRPDRTLDRRSALRIFAGVGLGALAGGVLVREAIRLGGLHRVRETRPGLGTLITLDIVHPERDGASALVAGAFATIERLEAILSRYRSESALGRLNRDGVLEAPPPELTRVVGYALEIARSSGGAFDPTVAPLVELYASGAGARIPTRSEIEATRKRVGHEAVRVAPDRIHFERPGMALTLDGVAKGFVVDRALDRLVAGGAERVLVEAGGDLTVGGDRGAVDPWSIAVPGPPHATPPPERIRLFGGGVATSGDYMRSFTEDRAAHHIIDPRTGYSPPELSEVTVVAPTAMEADAISTAALVLGGSAALDFLEGLVGVTGRVVSKEGRVSRTPGFG